MAFSSSIVSFADVAHQKLDFDLSDDAARLGIELIDTPWFQRLRRIAQTGNTKLVYTFAEHSRFGHCVGVAYLALKILDQLERSEPESTKPYRKAVIAAAVLHDLGHSAPGSHLAERVWSTPSYQNNHEILTERIIRGDKTISEILEKSEPGLVEKTCQVLKKSSDVPAWTHEILTGDGWNIDRGNWCIVDSSMCAVSYGRYNVEALIDGFALTPGGELVLKENRLDALTHFLMARDSMYRQVYQHRTLQAADILVCKVVERAREIKDKLCFSDNAMTEALSAEKPFLDLSLETIFQMTEPWWSYHIERWCEEDDPILRDLATRVRDRRLFKTIRLPADLGSDEAKSMIENAKSAATRTGFDPSYYVNLVNNKDRHRKETDRSPKILLESGKTCEASEIEPYIKNLFSGESSLRIWLAVPKRVKEILGVSR